MQTLLGKRVVLTGTRKTEELATIVKKLGGTPLLRPAQGTVTVPPHEVERAVGQLVEQPLDWLILTTGIGAEHLYQAAARIHAEDAFLAKLQQCKIAARGYKTVRYLKTLGLAPTVRDDDGTTSGLIRALEPVDLEGCQVALQLYGDPAPRLVEWLTARKAQVTEILPYQHIPPDKTVTQTLLDEILQDKVDAVTFTSTPQVRYLMAFARERQLQDEVIARLNQDIVAVAVGKVTAEALRDEGVTRIIFPKEERMGSMMVTLAKYYGQMLGQSVDEPTEEA